MFKKIGALLVTILGGLLLVYSATRSLDFIMLTLPPDRQILAYFGLAALDGGLIAWILAYLYGSRGGWQRAISILMVLVDLVGAVAMFTLDTLYQTGKSGMTTALTPDEIQSAVLALSGVIALNIAATVAHHLTDPEKLKEQAEEEAFAKVEDATLKQISQNADTLAAQVAPMLAADWMQNSRARYLANLGTGIIPTIDATAKDAPALPVVKKSGDFLCLHCGKPVTGDRLYCSTVCERAALEKHKNYTDHRLAELDGGQPQPANGSPLMGLLAGVSLPWVNGNGNGRKMYFDLSVPKFAKGDGAPARPFDPGAKSQSTGDAQTQPAEN
ncbi:MAG: hypothetical protein DDG60_00785 [Anaerolineae bacterium]|nr:MAG: hypothetical protein DDG60_00785 [Anaerolineae bacterium]